MGKWVHRMLVIDLELMEGECAHCGEVKLIRKGKRYSCANAVKEFKIGKQGIYLTTAKKIRESKDSCEICGSITSLVLDHCHSTLQIRGVLCKHCNWGLGHFKDDQELLQRAIEYLDKY